MSEQQAAYTCRLCGWEYVTMDGLLGHIPTHRITLAQYGTLAEVDALRAELEASRAREAALEAELYEQWASNHSEHCRSLTVEHDGDCYWPLPALLAGRAAQDGEGA